MADILMELIEFLVDGFFLELECMLMEDMEEGLIRGW